MLLVLYVEIRFICLKYFLSLDKNNIIHVNVLVVKVFQCILNRYLKKKSSDLTDLYGNVFKKIKDFTKYIKGLVRTLSQRIMYSFK